MLLHMRIRDLLSAAVVTALAAALAWVPVAGAESSSVATDLLIGAAKTESAAYLQYFGYADVAARSRRSDLADVWRTVGEVEHQDHWTHETTLAGLYSGSDNVANLKDAIPQARETAKADRRLAAKAPKASDAAVQLEAVARREDAAADLLARALQALQGHGRVPAAPAVKQVPITVSAKPRYSGAFYADLTGSSDSALEMAAWNWAEYQFLAKTAVDTGQADLAALLSGLEAQERYQNWPAISNAAGYTNSNAANLRASIASEQGAIDMYTHYARQAEQAGDSSVSGVFLGIKADEAGHRKAFTTELNQLARGH
jgi:rubrerythrin